MKRGLGPLLVSALMLVVSIAVYCWQTITASQTRPVQISEPPGLEEEAVVDKSPVPPNGPLHMALVADGVDGETGYRAYALEACRGTSLWAEESKVVWLYTADGTLGRGLVGRAYDVDAPPGSDRCRKRKVLYGVRSRRDFLVAAPHGHGIMTTETDPARWPVALTAALKKRALAEPAFHISAWTLPDGQLLYAATREPLRSLDEEEDDGAEELVERKTLTLGWFDPRTQRDRLVTHDCGYGYVRGVFDLNRDGRVEIVVDNGLRNDACEWDGKRFRRLL